MKLLNHFTKGTIAVLAALIISLANNKYVLYISMIFLLLYLFSHLFRSFKKAYRSSLFEGLTGLVRKFRTPFEKGANVLFWKKVEVDPGSDQKDKDYNQQVLAFYFFYWAVEFVAEKVRHVARSRKPDLYLMISWLVTVMITSLVYAFEYLALYKINPSSFEANHVLSVWSFIGFSFGKLTPSSISSIIPNGPFSTILCLCNEFIRIIKTWRFERINSLVM